VRSIPFAFVSLACALVSSAARAEAPLLTADMYGLVGELPASRLYFHGTAYDASGAARSVDASGKTLGFLGGTYYGLGTMFRGALWQTRFGSLMLGFDMAGGYGGVVAAPRGLDHPPSAFFVGRASVDLSWAIVSRSLLLSYGASLGGRLVGLSFDGLGGSSDDQSSSSIFDTGVYSALWFRPAYLLTRSDDGSVYLGGMFLMDPVHPDFREYGLTFGVSVK
jgi:hypothetical protein